MKYLLSEIAHIVKCQHNIIQEDNEIHSIYIDTRQISISQNSLFIAISTHKNDGHLYLENAYQKGIRNFLVENHFFERNKEHSIFKDNANYIIVENTVRALQSLAQYHRQKFDIPIMGITGSNGKTIVKEWLYFLLKDDYSICRSPKSFNSQIGVPLSVLNLNETHQLGIFEAGISLPYEMYYLQKIIQPTIGILTHFGSAHSEGFSNETEKLKEKLKLFSTSPLSIVQRYENLFLQENHFPHHYICISEKNNDTVNVQKIEKKEQVSIIYLKIKEESYSFHIPFVDEASIKNAITCFTCIYYLNKNLIQKLLTKFSELPVISLRMEVKKGKYQSTLINDYYNLDIDSFKIAISYLHQYTSSPNKILILSDFEEIKTSENIYQNSLQIISQYFLSKIILIGKEWQKFYTNHKNEYNNENISIYSTTADFIDNIFSHANDFFNAVILIKGARVFEFEKVASYLELKTHNTILEVNIPALWHNLNYYKNLVSKNTKLMCMLKASGYGSGSAEMAFALQKFGIDYIAVAYTDEGVELKQANIQAPIMVMLPEKNSFNDLIEYQLEPEIYSFDILYEFVQYLEKQGIQHYPIHIKIDTGMHRLGFMLNEKERLAKIIKNTSTITVMSIFSHLSASESDEHKEYTLKQIKLFAEISEYLEKQLKYKVLKHICNSAAISRYPQAHFDMVRIGIGMYGITDSPHEEKYLENVLSLKTKIVQIKELQQGQSVGYNRKGMLQRNSKIAIIPIGYADGFSRKLSNGAFQVKINNTLCPTIGNVCMDMTMIDITDINACENDEVIVFHSVEDIKKIASAMNTIPYEVLTSISQRVKRVYIYE